MAMALVMMVVSDGDDDGGDDDDDGDDDAGTNCLQDQHGDIPAHWACMLGRSDCVEVLTEISIN